MKFNNYSNALLFTLYNCVFEQQKRLKNGRDFDIIF